MKRGFQIDESLRIPVCIQPSRDVAHVPVLRLSLPDTQQTAVAQRTDTTDRLRSPRKADTEKITEPFSTDFLTHDESVRF